MDLNTIYKFSWRSNWPAGQASLFGGIALIRMSTR